MKSSISGVVFWEQQIFRDDRGDLLELFRMDTLNKEHFPQMAYISSTKPGILRGPHLHKDQTDLFVFLGKFKLYLMDAEGYGLHYGEEHIMDVGYGVIVPPGVIHAYRNVGVEIAQVFNAPNQLYAGAGKRYPVDEERLEEDERFMKIFRERFTLD